MNAVKKCTRGWCRFNYRGTCQHSAAEMDKAKPTAQCVYFETKSEK